MFPTASSERICNSLKRAGMAASHSAKSLRNIRTSTPFTRTRRRERLLCCAAPIPPCVRRPCHAERLTSNASRCRSWITAHSESGLLARRSPSRVGFLWGYPDVERVSISSNAVCGAQLASGRTIGLQQVQHNSVPFQGRARSVLSLPLQAVQARALLLWLVQDNRSGRFDNNCELAENIHAQQDLLEIHGENPNGPKEKAFQGQIQLHYWH